MSCKSTRNFILLLLAFILLGVAYTWPVTKYFNTSVPHTRYTETGEHVSGMVQGDHLQVYYRFWLFGEVASGKIKLYQDKYEFNLGEDDQRTVVFYFMPFPLIFFPFWLFSHSAAYNAVVLSTFPLTGLAMYLLMMHYTKNRFASFLSAVIFTIGPYRLITLLSAHPTGFAFFFLPLMVYLVEKMLAGRSMKYSWLAGLVFLALTDNDLHILYLTSIILPFFFLKHLVRIDRKRFFNELWGYIKVVLPFASIAIVAGFFLVYRLNLLDAKAIGTGRTLTEILNFTPHLSDAFRRTNFQQARYVYLGFSSTALVAVVSLMMFKRSFSSVDDRKYFIRLAGFLFLLFFSYMLAFGLRFPVSAVYRFFYEHVPKYSSMRQSSKLMSLATFALSVCAGLSFAYLAKRYSKKAVAIIGAIVLCAVLVDYWPSGPAGTSVLKSDYKAYQEVFDGNEFQRVVNVPIWPGDSSWESMYLYYATVYRTVMINGYSPAEPGDYKENIFDPLKGLNAGQLSRGEYDKLKSLDLDYLIFHQEAFPQKVCIFPAQYALNNLKRSPYIKLLSDHSPITVFKILDESELPEEKIEFISSPVGAVYEGEYFRYDLNDESIEKFEDEKLSKGKGLALSGERQKAWSRRRTTPAGHYSLTARVNSGEDAAGLTLSVVKSKDKSVVSSSIFNINTAKQYENISIEFELDRAAMINFVVEKEEGEELMLDWFYLKFADQHDPIVRYEIEEMFHMGNTAPVEGASGGSALYLDRIDPKTSVVNGPCRLLQPGAYEISVAAALTDSIAAEQDPVIFVDILDGKGFGRKPGRRLVERQTINAGDFSERRLFQKFNYEVIVDRPVFINVELIHCGWQVYLDYIMITRKN
jgi:hypothetical protein